MSDDRAEEPSVKNVSESHRYEISVGGELAGLTAYVDADGQRIFYHTETGEQFAGRGLAAILVSGALADTRSAGKRIVAVCPYVAKYVKKHHDFDDILDPVTPEALKTVRADQA